MKNKAKKLVNAFAIVFFLVPVFASAYTVTDGIRSCSISPDSGDGEVTLTTSTLTGFLGLYTCALYLPTDSVVGELGGNTWTDQPLSGFVAPRNSGITPTGMYRAVIFDTGSEDCNSLNYDDCLAGGTAGGDIFESIAPPPSPPSPNSLAAAVGAATSSFDRTFGFSMEGVSNWMWLQLGQPIVGSGLGTLMVLRWYIFSLIALSVIIFFCFAYFRFFKQ